MSRDTQDRLLLPILVPLFSLAVIGFVVFAFSRVLLAVPHEMATPIALAMALNVLTAGALIASLARVRSRALVGVMVVGALVLGGGGVTAMAVSGELESLLSGEPPVEQAHGEPGGEEPAGEEEPTAEPSPTAEETPEAGEEPPAAGGGTTIAAMNVSFDKTELSFPAGQATTLTFENQEAVPHNVAIYTQQGGDSLFSGEVFPGPDSREYAIPALEAGSYYFQCDVHPNMNGTVAVA